MRKPNCSGTEERFVLTAWYLYKQTTVKSNTSITMHVVAALQCPFTVTRIYSSKIKLTWWILLKSDLAASKMLIPQHPIVSRNIRLNFEQERAVCQCYTWCTHQTNMLPVIEKTLRPYNVVIFNIQSSARAWWPWFNWLIKDSFPDIFYEFCPKANIKICWYISRCQKKVIVNGLAVLFAFVSDLHATRYWKRFRKWNKELSL